MSLTSESKFYATSRSVGVLTICLNLGLGAELRGKLELPNICHAKYRKKNWNILIYNWTTTWDTGFS